MLKKILTTVVQHGRRAVEESILRGSNVSKIHSQTTKHIVKYKYQLGNEAPIFQTRWINSVVGNSVRNLASVLRVNGVRQFQSGPATVFSGAFIKRFPLYAFVGIGLSQCNNDDSILKSKVATEFCTEIKEIASKNTSSDEVQKDGSNLPGHRVNDYVFGKMISKGCNAAVYEAKVEDEEENINGKVNLQAKNDHEDESFMILDLDENSEGKLQRSIDDNDLAIKVMFNLFYESNQPAIIRGMEKELLPAKEIVDRKGSFFWNIGHHPKKKNRLPHHPNIINIKKVFVDDMVELESSQVEFPDSLPIRINSRGLGRNKTLYIVMDRYSFTLREYMKKEQLCDRDAIILFAQLLEGILHLHNNKVAHRDLKSDNILINKHPGQSPELVITDFGCCVESLKIPYNTDEVDKGGNFALMAPEIANAVPGDNAYLNYNKSDIWAAGTLAYEIYGQENPFYRSWGSENRINSRSYAEKELPQLAEWVPSDIQRIVSKMLKKNPNQRPKPRLVADALQLLLWAPKEWFLDSHRQEPRKEDVLDWLQVLFVNYILGNKNTVEYKLKAMFLSRLDINHVMEALRFLYN